MQLVLGWAENKTTEGYWRSEDHQALLHEMDADFFIFLTTFSVVKQRNIRRNVSSVLLPY
jgi:hypothetical protein